MIPTREIGKQGLIASTPGLGCMGMSQSYGPADERESIATIHRAIELGMFFLDTANVYGDGHNERLVRRAIADRRDRVILATRFGLMLVPSREHMGRAGHAIEDQIPFYCLLSSGK